MTKEQKRRVKELFKAAGLMFLNSTEEGGNYHSLLNKILSDLKKEVLDVIER